MEAFSNRSLDRSALGARPNVSFPRGLKTLLGLDAHRYAVIDVGTNSVKFHVGERRADGAWAAVTDRAEVTRLGEGLDETGSLQPEAMERTTGGANCGLGRITLAVDPEGNVYPCMQWRHRALGNVRTTPLRELWHASEVRREAADVSTRVNDRLVAEGGAISEFPYCPAIAMQETGDPLVPDRGFRLRAEIAAELRR